MDRKLDVIYEEIKRENFFNRIKQAMPYIIGTILCILSFTAWHSWKNYKQEHRLMEEEALYEHGLFLYSKGQKEEAIKIMDRLIQETKSFRFLAICQKGIWEKEGQTSSTSSVSKNFQEDLKRHYGSIVELISFFDICHGFEIIHLPMAPLDKQNIWHAPWLLREGLLAYHEKNKEKTLKIFQELRRFFEPDEKGYYNWWSLENEFPKWIENLEYINYYVTLGAMAVFFEKKNQQSSEEQLKKHSMNNKRKKNNRRK